MPLAADFLEALKSHPTPYIAVGDDGAVLSMNHAATQLLGPGSRAAIGDTWRTLLRPSERARAEESPLPSPGEWELSDEAGSPIRCRLSMLPLEVFEGVALLVALTDIRTEEEIDTSLRNREMTFRQMAGSVPGALFRYVLFPDGTDAVKYVSPGCFDLWELEAEDVEQDTTRLWKMVAADDIKGLQASVMHSTQSLEPWFHEWRITTPSGRHKWLQGSARPIRQSDGSTLWNSFVLDVTERKLHEQQQSEVIRGSREQLRSLAVRLQDVREEERKELALELHDQVGQYLTVMGMDLHEIRTRCDEGVHPVSSIEHLSTMLDETLDIVQSLTARLRPPMLDARGLGPAITAHVEKRLSLEGGVVFHLDIDGRSEASRGLDPNRALAVFRVFQESTTNVLRHSEATEAWVRLSVDDDGIVLEVEDNGVGITQERTDERLSLGLIGMRERMHAIGGTFMAGAGPRGGTLVRATAPLPAQ